MYLDFTLSYKPWKEQYIFGDVFNNISCSEFKARNFIHIYIWRHWNAQKYLSFHKNGSYSWAKCQCSWTSWGKLLGHTEWLYNTEMDAFHWYLLKWWYSQYLAINYNCSLGVKATPTQEVYEPKMVIKPQVINN